MKSIGFNSLEDVEIDFIEKSVFGIGPTVVVIIGGSDSYAIPLCDFLPVMENFIKSLDQK